MSEETLLRTRKQVCAAGLVTLQLRNPTLHGIKDEFVSWTVTHTDGTPCCLEGVEGWSNFIFAETASWVRLRTIAPHFNLHPIIKMRAVRPEDVMFGEWFRFELITHSHLPPLKISGMHESHKLHWENFINNDQDEYEKIRSLFEAATA